MKFIPTLPAILAMSDSARILSSQRRERSPSAGAATAVIAAAALTVLAAACSGSPQPGSSAGSSNAGRPATASNAGGPTISRLVGFSDCVRSHGVAGFPDPQAGASNAKFPSAQQLRVSTSRLGAAEKACQHLLPVGTDDQFPAAEVPLMVRAMLPFSRCMRSHGVPNFPDPAVDSEGRPLFPLSAHGISLAYSHSPHFTAVVDECQRLVPRQLGGIPFG